MQTRYSDQLQDISNTRKTAVINDKLNTLKVDIVSLKESWLANKGTIIETDYMFYWRGKTSDESRVHGVGFALLKILQLLTLCLNTSNGPITLVSVYSSTPETKMSSTRTCQPSSAVSPARSSLFSWMTSMHEWALTMTLGPLLLER